MDSPLGGGSLGESGDARMACPPSPAPLSASLHTEEGARAPVAPRPTVQPSLTSDEPQKTGALTPDLRAAPSPHKTAAAAPFYEPPLHESTLLAPPTTSRGAPIVEPSARAPCAPAAPPPAGPPPAQGPAPPPASRGHSPTGMGYESLGVKWYLLKGRLRMSARCENCDPETTSGGLICPEWSTIPQ